MVNQWYYQNVQYVEVKNQDLLKIKKQKDFLLAGDKCMPEMHLKQPGFS